MTHHFGWPGTSYSCPTCGRGATSAPTGYHTGKPTGQWPFFGPYGPGFAPHPLSYPAAPTGPIDDRDIREMASDYLRSDPRLSPEAEIAVDVSNGVVTLTGTAPDKWTKFFVGDDCFNIPAVVDVVNKLRITETARIRGRRERRGRMERS